MHVERSRIAGHGSVRRVALLVVLTVWADIISAQSPPQIHSIAADLAEQIERSKVKGSEGSRGPRVLVLPFPYSGEIELLLGGRGNRYEVADRACVVDLISELKLPENEHLNHPVAAWLGKRCGADLVVTVSASLSKDQVRLEFALLKTRDAKVVRSLTRNLPWSGDNPSVPRKARSVSTSSAGAAPLGKADPIEKAKKDVVVFPQCQQCANPEFTNDAINAKGYRGGTVLLRLVVTAEGRATNIQLVRGAPFGLNEQAIGKVQTWKFKPARNVCGEPVDARIMVEVRFRQY
ncbi:MAG: energy transducer TonB [Candidatus Acidiferrales bacterium]